MRPFDANLSTVIIIFAIIVVVLATARITRLATLDVITLPMRQWIDEKLKQAIEKKHRTRILWKFLSGMIWCYWCTGFWIALFTTTPAVILAAYHFQLPVWLAVIALMYLTPAVAYAASWVLDYEKSE